MTVRANKPAFSIREKLKELQKPIGLKGSELMRAETAQDAFSLIGAGRKNYFINGDFKIWQRGTSFGNSPIYTADRWRASSNNTGSTVTRETFSNGQTEVPGGPTYFYRCALTTISTAGDRIAWQQKVEDWKTFLGNTFTISGWYRRTASISGTALQINMSQSSGFYDVATTLNLSTEKLFPETSTWRYFSKSFTFPTNAAGTMTESANVDIRLYYQVCTAAGNFDLANMQLERGNVATPFEHRSYGEELALCQRYYQTTNTASVYSAPSGIYGDTAIAAWQLSATQGAARVRLPVEMRAEPTGTVIGTVTSSPGSSGTIGFYGNAAWMSPISLTVAEPTRTSIRLVPEFSSNGSGKDAFGIYFYGTYLTSTVQLNAEL